MNTLSGLHRYLNLLRIKNVSLYILKRVSFVVDCIIGVFLWEKRMILSRITLLHYLMGLLVNNDFNFSDWRQNNKVCYLIL